MGWRGGVRSLAAAERAAAKESLRERKIALKQQMIANAADAVGKWERYIENITSIHTNAVSSINWQEVAATTPPAPPVRQTKHHDAAKAALDAFKPHLFDFFYGGSEKRKQRLEAAIEKARTTDAAEFKSAEEKYTSDVLEWEKDTALATSILRGEPSGLNEIVNEYRSTLDKDLMGRSIEFSISDNFVHAKPIVHTIEIVPNFRLKQSASGKLSQTKMPTGQFYELYQDYVASVAIKVANDLFHILPLEEIYVTCLSQLLNTKNGHLEITPILSVQFVRDTIQNLNLSNIDASDALSNFNHIMTFKRTTGFSPITPIKPLE